MARKSRNATPNRPTAKARRQPTAKPMPKGARRVDDNWRNQMDAWKLHHKASAKDAWQRMRKTPIATAMTVIVIAIALALPAGLSVLLTNAQHATADWDGNAHLSVFLQQGTSEKTQQQLAKQWAGKKGIDRVDTITSAEALVEFRELSGFGEALDALPDNPLPPVLVVYPTPSKADDLEQLSNELGNIKEVDLVQLDMQWVKRLHAMMETVSRIVNALMLALAAAVMLVVVNTIRLAIESRRDEIVVVKIVGGTDGFVRRPFLYTGFGYGLLGGVLAVVLVQMALLWVGKPLDELILLYDSQFVLLGVGLKNLVVIPLFAGMLGLLGAWLAVSRHIQDVDPYLL